MEGEQKRRSGKLRLFYDYNNSQAIYTSGNKKSRQKTTN